MNGDSQFRTGTTKSTLVAVWTGEPTISRLSALEQSMRDLCGNHPNIEHAGVQYTMSRAIIGTLTTIARSPFSMKTFDKRDTAAEWLTIACKVPPQTLVALAAQLQAEMSE